MADPLHILITGGAGQVGMELRAAAWPEGVVLHAPSRAELDLSNAVSITAAFAACSFAAVINCGAYTAVDKAENDVAAAFASNAAGPAMLADLTRKADVPLIQLSTDYVFNGSKPAPYVEEDPVGPLNVYGASKLAGELAALTGNPRALVLRTAWVISPHRTNFLQTMLRQAGEASLVRVVGDQRGCPTSAQDLAAALQTIALRMIADREAPTGVYHFANAGETTWAELAGEIFARSAEEGGASAVVETTSSSDYATPARRPSNSRLATGKLTRDYGITPRPWREAVAEIIAELSAERTLA